MYDEHLCHRYQFNITEDAYHFFIINLFFLSSPT